MYVIIGILFVALGIVMLISPKTFFELTESWKGMTSDEPSSLYIISTRFGGAAFLVVGILSIVVSLLGLI